MAAGDGLLLLIGIALTATSTISGYFILTEVILILREWSSGEPRAIRLQKRNLPEDVPKLMDGVVLGGTGPLVAPPWRERIQPMRDTNVVKQLIDHFTDDVIVENSGESPSGAEE